MRAACVLFQSGLSLLAAVMAQASVSRAAEPNPPLQLEATVPLADVSGRIDHMAIDLARNRLILAELGNGTVDVIHLSVGKPVQRLSGLREPQGVGYMASTDLIAVASAGDGSVRLYRGEDLAPVAALSLGDDADNVRVDPRNETFVVGYGSGGVAGAEPRSPILGCPPIPKDSRSTLTPAKRLSTCRTRGKSPWLT
jgi:hypothetical protein